jgi:hypothetical protein
MENIIAIGYSKFWTSDDILYIQFCNNQSNSKLVSEKVELYIEVITKLCQGKAMPFLIDARDSRGTFSSSAASLIARSPALVNLRISEAFILNSIGIKLLIESYKRIYEPKTPYAIFSELAAAKEYCVASKNKFYHAN